MVNRLYPCEAEEEEYRRSHTLLALSLTLVIKGRVSDKDIWHFQRALSRTVRPVSEVL